MTDSSESPPVPSEPLMQDLSRFSMPPNFRGRSALYVQFWWMVQATLFRWSPQFAYRFRAALLRVFGATVGRGVLIRPTATVTYPWKVVIGAHAWIGDHAVLYSLGDIHIGSHAVISQKSYLCAADHDYRDATFPIRARSIRIGDQCWLAADTFVAPGVTIGRGTVVGARSTVLTDLPGAQVFAGSPCKFIRHRVS